MRVAALAPLLAALLLVGVANAATADSAAPTGLHAFLLRVDETPPPDLSFDRTPSFAWQPVAGANAYQFQLSTSDVFRSNSIQYSAKVTAPVVAPPLDLPWISGNPHGLYARVRALVGTEVTPWSQPYGFDMAPDGPPTPLPSDPGLLRWTPIEGADFYQVWLVDVRPAGQAVGKQIMVRTNVLDEREVYTFHQSASWISSVRWRVRAVRCAFPDPGQQLLGLPCTIPNGPTNKLPAVSYGAWSPIYQSSNPAVTGGPIKLLHSMSDIVQNGTNPKAARLMPGFTWTGNQSLAGTAAELYRVEIFTDKTCLNLVYASPVVGSPAYAPRPFGTMGMPTDPTGIAAARSTYLQDGPELNDFTYDGMSLLLNEQMLHANPTITPPIDDDLGDTGGTAPGGGSSDPGSSGSSDSGSSGSSGGSSGSSGGSAPATGVATPPQTTIGAPVDLWDTDFWPKTGYYWTVVPVGPASTSSGSSTVSAPGASQGSTIVPVADPSQFQVGQSITIGTAPASDTATITLINNGLLTIATPLNVGHAVGAAVVSTAPSGTGYYDLELASDACASGRVQRFGLSSEPSLTSGGAPFATGLSPTGGTVSSPTQPSTVFGQPLVAWTPALGAQVYEVEWSKTDDPKFSASTGGQLMTYATSAVLTLAPGTWYYRVRGFDFNMPTGQQAMSWSNAEQIVSVKPVFKVVKAIGPKFKILPPKKGK